VRRSRESKTSKFGSTGGLVQGQPYRPSGLFGHFLLIPRSIASDKGLSPGAKLCFGQMLYHTGKHESCWPGQTTLSKALGIGYSQVRRYVDELEEARLIRCEKRRGDTSLYFPLWREELAHDLKREDQPCSDTSTHPAHKRADHSAQKRADSLRKNEHQRDHHQDKVKNGSEENQRVAHKGRGSNQTLRTDGSDERSQRPQLLVDDDDQGSSERYTLDTAGLIAVYEDKIGCPPEKSYVNSIVKTVTQHGTMRGFMDELLQHFGNTWKNPPGFIRWSAKEYAERCKTNLLNRLRSGEFSFRSEQPPPAPKCNKCGGRGILSGLNPLETLLPNHEYNYCECKEGSALRWMYEETMKKGPEHVESTRKALERMRKKYQVQADGETA
jgi:hypothetical protein